MPHRSRKHHSSSIPTIKSATPKRISHISYQQRQAVQRAILTPNAQTVTPDVIESIQRMYGNQFANDLVQRSLIQREEKPSRRKRVQTLKDDIRGAIEQNNQRKLLNAKFAEKVGAEGVTRHLNKNKDLVGLLATGHLNR